MTHGGIPSRGLKTAAMLGAGRLHGDRLRYLAGCKCRFCRRANSQYEAMRKIARANGDWNGIVDADRARRRIKALSMHNVGRRAIAMASDVGATIIQEIRSGKRRRIRARTERRILAVTIADARDHALVPAARTWTLIRKLRAEGFTRQRIAKDLGYGPRRPDGYYQLQLGKKNVTVRNAWKVKKLYERLTT